MQKNDKIYVAGHTGLMGSALVRHLAAAGHSNLLVRTHRQLDLTRQNEVHAFFETERPDHVFLAAAKVGGILANATYPGDFIAQNLQIQINVIEEARRAGVKSLLFLGSSCIYPKLAPQPIKEECLLTGPLEETNRAYAIAKIAGIEMCDSYNRQYGTRYLAAMPTNLYGPGDNYDLNNSHVIPAMIRKFHEAKEREAGQVVLWGTGAPRREFLYSDDAAHACVFLLNLADSQLDELISQKNVPPVVNVGFGEDLTIRDLAALVAETVDFHGEFVFDTSKPDGTPRKLMDISRLKKLGWKPRINLREGLKAAYRDFIRAQASGSVPVPAIVV
jgi:GDP-L-fucose synthase